MVGSRVALALLLCGVIAAASRADDWQGWAVNSRRLHWMSEPPVPGCANKPNECCAIPSGYHQISNPS